MIPPFAPFVTSLYIHVPFCALKCEYCAFYSEIPKGDVVNRYVSALGQELESVAPGLRPQTVYFGGGTPSLLSLRQWEQILATMGRLGLLGALEWTVECNPATVSLDKAKLLRDHGVNRISMGIQSLDDDLLDRLGRVHSRAMVFKSFDLLRQTGFDNLNLDLMFAIPGQTLAAWRQTLRDALALGSEHLSSYETTYEDDTPLFEQLKAGRFAVDEDLACDMYEELVATATQAGFVQYEVSNFARPGPSVASCSLPVAASPSPSLARPTAPGPRPSASFAGSLTDNPRLPNRACLHNVNYWRGGSFYGLGPSAASYVRGVRTRNWANTQLYAEMLECGRRPIESREELEPLARAGEIAAFGLRMTAGWPFEQFQAITGFDLRQDWAAEMGRLIQVGFARSDAQGFQLTPRGLRFADWVAEQFIRPQKP